MKLWKILGMAGYAQHYADWADQDMADGGRRRAVERILDDGVALEMALIDSGVPANLAKALSALYSDSGRSGLRSPITGVLCAVIIVVARYVDRARADSVMY